MALMLQVKKTPLDRIETIDGIYMNGEEHPMCNLPDHGENGKSSLFMALIYPDSCVS